MKKIITIIISLMLMSCNFSSNVTYENEIEEKENAEIVSRMFYSFLVKDDFNSTIDLISPSFFKVSSKVDLLIFLKNKREKFGKFKSFVMQDWKTHRVKGTNAETLYAFIYKVEYEKGVTIEKLKMVKEDKGIKIYGYDVD